MQTAVTARNLNALPTCAKTGLTLPLSKSLGSQELARHRAVVAVELEVLAKKFDRFGWERDRGSAAHDRLLLDWMDALQDYPLEEIRAACRAAVLENPNRMPNEGHVRAQILDARRKLVQMRPRQSEPEPPRARSSLTAEQRAQVAASLGLKKIGAG